MDENASTLRVDDPMGCESATLDTVENKKQNILKALELNRQLQLKIKERLLAFEESRKRNLGLQSRLKELKHEEENKESPKTKSELNTRNVPFFGPPFFVDKNNETPPDNEDTIKKRNIPATLPKSQRWLASEKALLAKAVKERNMKLLAKKLMASNRSYKDVVHFSDQQILDNVQDLQFEQQAKRYLPSRTPAECLIQWTNHDHPLVNEGPWSKAEVTNLRSVADRHNRRDWKKIAIAHGNNRTAAACFKEWSKQVAVRRKWTEEEDRILIEAVDLYGEKNWQQVAHCLDDRTGQQCMHRWTKSLTPEIRNGRWEPEEDEALRNAVKVYGVGRWVKVQKYVLGRTDVQCRERWTNVLDPSLNKEKWTAEEDELLINLVKEIGVGNWSRIATRISKGRTDNQCWRRYKSLSTREDKVKKRQAKKAEKANEIKRPKKSEKAKKMAMPSNGKELGHFKPQPPSILAGEALIKLLENTQGKPLNAKEQKSEQFQILQDKFRKIFGWAAMLGNGEMEELIAH